MPRGGKKQKVRAEVKKKYDSEGKPEPPIEQSPEPPTDQSPEPPTGQSPEPPTGQLQDVSVGNAETKKSMDGGDSWANEVEQEKRQEEKASEQSHPGKKGKYTGSRQFYNSNRLEKHKQQSDREKPATPKKERGQNKDNRADYSQNSNVRKQKEQESSEKNVERGQESSENSMEWERPASRKKRGVTQQNKGDSSLKEEDTKPGKERSVSPKKDNGNSRKTNNDRSRREGSTDGKDNKDGAADQRNDSRNSGRPYGDQNYGRGQNREKPFYRYQNESNRDRNDSSGKDNKDGGSFPTDQRNNSRNSGMSSGDQNYGRWQNRDRNDPSGKRPQREGEQSRKTFYNKDRSDGSGPRNFNSNDNRARNDPRRDGRNFEQGAQSRGRGRGFGSYSSSKPESSSGGFSDRQHYRDAAPGKFDGKPWDKISPAKKEDGSAMANQEAPESTWENAYDNWNPTPAESAEQSWKQPEDSTSLNPNAKPFGNVPEELDDGWNSWNKPKARASQKERKQSPDRQSHNRWSSPRRSVYKNPRSGYGDPGFDEFHKYLRSFSGEFVKVKEMEGDLFAMSAEYSLAHCVAEDMNMGSGIAVIFSNRFKRREELYQQQQREGGLAILKDKERYIYYLVTKVVSQGKPTMYTLWCSLQKMREHVEENNVSKLAMPRIGCGLDRLEWDKVKPMIEFVFKDTNVEIVVCNLQQTEGAPSPKNTNAYVKHVAMPVVDIEAETAIIFLGTEDGHVSDTIHSLNTKFNFLFDYRSAVKKVGQVLKFQKRGYVLYAFIVKKTEEDPLDLINFSKCIFEYKKACKSDGYYYIGIEAFEETGMQDAIFKVVNVLKQYAPNKMEIYVCWPSGLRHLMPGAVA